MLIVKQQGKFVAVGSTFTGNVINGLGSCISSGTCNSKGGALFLNVMSTSLNNCVFEGNTVATTSTTVVSLPRASAGHLNALLALVNSLVSSTSLMIAFF